MRRPRASVSNPGFSPKRAEGTGIAAQELAPAGGRAARLVRRQLPAPAELAGALWALGAAGLCRLQLATGSIESVRLPPASRLPPSGLTGVEAVLGRLHAACLLRSCVLQAWLAAHGHPLDLVIGVRAPAQGFSAHAWLEEPGKTTPGAHTEILRIAPGRRSARGDDLLDRKDHAGQLLPARGVAQPVDRQAG